MKKMLTIVVALCAFVLIGCSGSSSDTPGKVVLKAYGHLQAGEYEKVSEMFWVDPAKSSPEEVEQGRAMLTSLMQGKAAPQIAKKGGLKSYEVVEESISEDGQTAKVKVRVVYGNGKEESENVPLKLSDDGWKLHISK